MSFALSTAFARSISIALIGLNLFVFGAPMGRAADEAPASVTASPTVTPDGGDAFVLEFREEPGGNTVDMRGFLRVLDKIFDDLRSQWDPLQGILEIKAEGRVIQALSRQALLIVDTRMQTVKRPIRVNSKGEVSIPVETVSLILKSLGVAFDIEAAEGGAAGKVSPAQADSASTSPINPAAPAVPAIPLGQSVPTGENAAGRAPSIDLGRLTGPSTSAGSAPDPTPSPVTEVDTGTPLPVIEVRPEAMATPAVSPVVPGGEFTPGPISPDQSAGQMGSPVLPPAQSGRLNLQVPTLQEPAPGQTTPIEAPTALAGRIGLTWGQLADLNHRQPPRRITVVCDRPLEAVARGIESQLRMGLDVEVGILIAPSVRRDSEGLLSSIVLREPDLLIDLLAVAAKPEGEQEQPFYVWVVHEALWPQDRKLDDGATRGLAQHYRRHQFQSLALGSRLRTELGQEFSGRMVFYELAPSYLLRRADAPSAAVLIPRASEETSSTIDDRLARAIAGAIRTYIHGMEAVRF